MIKLTVNPDSQAQAHVYYQDTVIIGSGKSHAVDLALSNENLQDIHISIVKRDANFLVINNSNDPFATLNGLPFGKKKLTKNDTLQIGKTIICIQATLNIEPASISSELPIYDTQTDLPKILDKILPEQKQHETCSEEDSKNPIRLDIEALIQEAELLDSVASAQHPIQSSSISTVEEEESTHEGLLDQLQPNEDLNLNETINNTNEPEAPLSNSQKAKRSSSAQQGQKLTLKDYYLNEFDDETESWNSSRASPSSIPTQLHNLRWFLCLFFLITLFIVIIAGVTYLSVSGKSEKEEIRAAEGVADVAMALTYAQIHHIKPQKQNWSDPDFLKNSLNAVLGFKYDPLISVDSHGQFHNASYILRIYTSSDQSQFLVIAQPAPSVLQWLIPKAAIMVDSKTMEMRKTKDIKILNRLLVNPNMLDGANALEISHIVSQGALIPLTTLGEKKDKREFSPPKALALLKPGAENYIYNAPRYYHFGEGFIKQALEINQADASSYEITRLQQETEGLAHYPDMILYTSRGIQVATEAQKALSTYVHQSKFLIAYLNFNVKGKVTSSHLIMDDFHSEGITDSEKQFVSENFTGFNALGQDQSQNSKNVGEIPISSSKNSNTEFNRNHPLFMQLNSLSDARTQALKTVSKQIDLLLHQNQDGLLLDYQPILQPLLAKYEELNQEYKIKIFRNFSHLSIEHSNIPFGQFMFYVDSAGLRTFMDEYLKATKEKLGAKSPSFDIELLLEKVRDSKNLEELDRFTTQAAAVLKLDHLPEPSLLMQYQNTLNILVLKKLTHLLLAPNRASAYYDFRKQNAAVLEHIMQTAWIVDPNEYAYYLNEFSALTRQTDNSKN